MGCPGTNEVMLAGLCDFCSFEIHNSNGCITFNDTVISGRNQAFSRCSASSNTETGHLFASGLFIF